MTFKQIEAPHPNGNGFHGNTLDLPTQDLPKEIALRLEESTTEEVILFLAELLTRLPLTIEQLIQALPKNIQKQIASQTNHETKEHTQGSAFISVTETASGLFVTSAPKIIFDISSLRITYDTFFEHISPREAELLEILLRFTHKAFTYQELYMFTHPDSKETPSRGMIEVGITRLRAKFMNLMNKFIGYEAGKNISDYEVIGVPFIDTLKGKGYIFTIVSLERYFTFLKPAKK